MKKNIILLFGLLSVLASCDATHFDIFAPDELGTSEKEFNLSAAATQVSFDVMTNKHVDVVFADGASASWATPSQSSFDSDVTIKVDIAANEGMQRRADLLLKTESRCDTVSIFQAGAINEFYVPVRAIVVLNGTGKPNVIDVDINADLSTVKSEINYGSGQEWIRDLKVSSKEISFNADDNTDPEYTRHANIILSHLNGWNQNEVVRIKVLQARADNSVGETYSPDKLHSLATVEGFKLPDDAIIEGLVVSDVENSDNAGGIYVEEYLSPNSGVIDYTLNQRTTYVEDLEGRNGFRWIAVNDGENAFNRYEFVSLNAGGAIVRKDVWKDADNVEHACYTVDGLKSSDILTRKVVADKVPVKEKAIGELTDDDLFTLVKVKNCEIPMRKGPLTPVNEGYTKACNYHRCAKYPMLIRDIQGGSMYMFTNMTCSYRRDGERLPYGSGDITGIIVHEDYKSFEKDGNIGNYQIRHLRREDIALAMDMKDSFSGIITEFRYAKFPDYDSFEKTELPNAILATQGNGEMCHTYGNTVGNYSPSYFYIGQCGGGYKNKYSAGAGIEMEDGSIYEPWVTTHSEGDQNTDGKGWFKDNLKISWSSKYWWNSGRGYCWLVKFSTKGISSDRVSMQFAMYNNSQSARSPRYWKAQYSLTTTDTSASSDSEWTDIGEFTVHDVAIWASQNDWQTVGTRVYDFPLPVEILDKDMVCIRLMPRNDKAAAKNVDSYDSSTIANNSGYNTMDYFAVRYNK